MIIITWRELKQRVLHKIDRWIYRVSLETQTVIPVESIESTFWIRVCET